MNYNKFTNWITRKMIPLGTLHATAIGYLIFSMMPARKHTLTAAAKFLNTTKSNFSYFLKNHSDLAIFALSELSKKQAMQFSKIMKGLANNSLPWNIAVVVDATFLNRSSLHTENAKKFNHGKGFVIGHQFTNIVLIINDKVIPLPPIIFYSKKYCREYGIQYKTENERVIEYIAQLHLEEYIGPYASEKVIFLADSGYDDHRIQKIVARKKWNFIIALKSSRSVKTEKIYHNTKKSEGWMSVTKIFKRYRCVEWKTIYVPKSSGKKKRMEFRIRQIIGYVKNFGKAQLICSEFKKKSKRRRKFLASNDMRASGRQIIIGYRLRWTIEIFHKEIKMFLGFEDVSAKNFSSVISHVHWVYCAYILLNSSPPGFKKGVKSMAEKQLTINKIVENKGLSAVNQLLTQVKGTARLKIRIQEALNGGSADNSYVVCALTRI